MAARRSTEAVRLALIEAAEAQIAERGAGETNSNAIARAAGVGVGTFYRHFEDKPAVVRAIVLLAWEELGRAIGVASDRPSRSAASRATGLEVSDDASNDATDDALDDAAGMTRAIVGYAARHPARFRVAFGPAASLASAAGRPQLTLSTRPIERRLGALQQAGRLPPDLDTALAARAWWQMVSGTLLWWLDDPSRASADTVVETLARLHPARALAIGAGR